MRRINIGHSVTVYYNNGDKIIGVVEHTPENSGDLWFVRRNDGMVVALNPSCSELSHIARRNINEDGPAPKPKGD